MLEPLQCEIKVVVGRRASECQVSQMGAVFGNGMERRVTQLGCVEKR